MTNNKLKILFAASSGGHFEQLLMLKPLMDKHESVLVTEKTGYGAGKFDVKTYYVKQINRKELLFIPKFIANSFKSLGIIIKEKPDVMITTGVLATIPLALLMKLFKKKLIYIESFAKVTSKTLSGKLLYKYADRFYVQWEEMLKLYPNAIYKGGIY
ncbi:MAG: polysaccharide biosynthesis protein [Lachnospiraceae bacterium]|nr:polysaccharide biosynthesis protein [Lachnospiraceae bacterium]